MLALVEYSPTSPVFRDSMSSEEPIPASKRAPRQADLPAAAVAKPLREPQFPSFSLVLPATTGNAVIALGPDACWAHHITRIDRTIDRAAYPSGHAKQLPGGYWRAKAHGGKGLDGCLPGARQPKRAVPPTT